MANLRLFLPLALGLALAACPSAPAKPAFDSSEIEGQGPEIFFSDLDGDGLKEAVLIDGLNLSIFRPVAGQGFTRNPQQRYRLAERPAVIWPARLGRTAESLLVMTSEGVAELTFTNRTDPPASQPIIKQPTIIPDTLDETPVRYFPLSADTGTDWPLLLLPVAGGLQVWQHRDGWRQVQFIQHAVDTHIRPSVANPGYNQTFGLSLSLSDVNGDGREDLMFRCSEAGGMQTYTLYRQNADGRFDPEPALTYTNHADWRTLLCWMDINRDGKLDLLQSVFSDEPSFVPWFPSSKVTVAVYPADAQGRIPAEPQQVFRKSDWSSALPLVDVDGDGFMDLVLGSIPMDTREGLRKAITAEQMDLNLKFHFYRPAAGFPRDPDCSRRLLLRFQMLNSPRADYRLYYEQLVSLNGDFNGDGKKDLLARDHGDAISVYFFVSRGKGFNSKPDFKFDCPEPIEWWDVEDLNGDGVSDLVVKLQKQDAFRIFTSQTKQPMPLPIRTDAVETTDGHR